jgi:hypothetical protein
MQVPQWYTPFSFENFVHMIHSEHFEILGFPLFLYVDFSILSYRLGTILLKRWTNLFVTFWSSDWCLKFSLVAIYSSLLLICTTCTNKFIWMSIHPIAIFVFGMKFTFCLHGGCHYPNFKIHIYSIITAWKFPILAVI